MLDPSSVSDVSTTLTTAIGGIGLVIVHTGCLDVKITYSCSFTEAKGNQGTLSITSKDLIKKAKKKRVHNKEKKERFF